nr:uncharacterized protein LOC129258953 [Lytechinus pictus]
MDQNPDSFFVVQGRRTPVRDKGTGYLTNSQRTLSTKNLSQTSTFRNTKNGAWTGRESFRDTRQSWTDEPSPENPYEEIQDNLRAKSSELSLDLRSLNSSLNKSLNKSVTFNETLDDYKRPRDEDENSLDDTFEEELQRLIANDAHENHLHEQSLAGKAKSKATAQWFTDPIHLSQETEYPVFKSLGAKEHTVSSVKRTTGMLGTEMAQKKVASSISSDEEVRRYFPVTFNEVPAVMQTLTPPPPMDSSTRSVVDRTTRSVMSDAGPRRTGTSRPPLPNGRSMSASDRHHNLKAMNRSSSRNGFPANGMSLRLSQGVSTQDPQLKAVKDYNYLKASQQFIDERVVASPFEYELSKLRMERLRIEEQRILETKRQEELERIRGPVPKWYELKTPNFTYEHAKNNQLNSSRQNWQSLYDYRNKLLSASQEFAKSTN